MPGRRRRHGFWDARRMRHEHGEKADDGLESRKFVKNLHYFGCGCIFVT